MNPAPANSCQAQLLSATSIAPFLFPPVHPVAPRSVDLLLGSSPGK